MILVEFLFPQKRFKLNHESADRELKVDAVDSLSLYNLNIPVRTKCVLTN